MMNFSFIKTFKLLSVIFVYACFLLLMPDFLPIGCSTSEINYGKKNKRITVKYGQLMVQGNQITDNKGEPVALHGMSLFWSHWPVGSKYYNYSCIKWLRDEWKCTVVRAAMGIEHDGYLVNPVIEKNKIKKVIEAAIDLGIYVIVDWHDHNAEDHQEEAINFFAEIAGEYGEHPNIIYEIYNEPLKVSWSEVIKPYAEAVIDTIRAIDPDNLIIVGTPAWSQDVDIAAKDPLEYKNIAYVLHFYAATHKQYLRDKAETALKKGIALFVSEFGTCEANGNGPIDYDELNLWFEFMNSNNLSWCNWSIADKEETSAALKPGADPKGNWTDSTLSESGLFIKNRIQSVNNTFSPIKKVKRK